MTIQFKTNTVYTLSSRGLIFKLECTYIDGTYAYLVNHSPTALYNHYKVSLKTNKFYVFNRHLATWDTIENTLSEDKLDIWQARSTHRYASAYDGSDQTLNGDD
jgi:hypothetical protein